jgi:hypothetical protein
MMRACWWPAILVAAISCGGGSASQRTAISESSTSAARPADPPDRCQPWIDKEVRGMSWYIGEYGLLDYVDIEKLPAVVRGQCDGLTDVELACVEKEQSIATDCLPQAKLDALRAVVLPLLELPPDLRAKADAATRCEYQTAMDLMHECANVPARFRALLDRAWASTANVQSPPFWCQVGVEVMKTRLAAIGC